MNTSAGHVCHVYLVRHGQAWWNVYRKMQGQVNIPLTEEGRMQAVAARRRLADISFDVCLSSPLSRARETAEIILEGTNVKIVDESLLIEQAYGLAEAESHDGFEREDSDIYGYDRHPERYVPPVGAESFDELNHRLRTFLYAVLIPFAITTDNILVASHGAALCALVNELSGGVPIEKFWERKLPNAGLGSFDIINGIPDPTTLYVEENPNPTI